MTYLIRNAAEKDRMAVYHFICGLEETNFDPVNFEIIYTKNIADKDNCYLVAESAANSIIGFISCHMQRLLHHCGKVAEIQELYTDKNYRNMGIGKALLNAMEKRLIENNCILFEVTAQNKRESTHRFYETNGFLFTHKKFVKQLS
jgi:(aminoalkyl)phosphonate N-acetyltransferase